MNDQNYILKLSRFMHDERHRMIHLAIMVGLMFITYLTVYEMGGTHTSYPYLSIIVIIYAAVIFKIKGALIMAFLMSVLMGPIMPLNTFEHIHQETTNMLVRMVFYLIIGFFAGGFSYLNKQNYIFMKNQLSYDTFTGIPLFSALTYEDECIEDEATSLIMIRVMNYNRIVQHLGLNLYNKVIKNISLELKRVINKEHCLYKIDSQNYTMITSTDNVNEVVNDLQKYFTVPNESIGVPIYFDVYYSIINRTGNNKEDLANVQSSVNYGIIHNEHIVYYEEKHSEKSKEYQLVGSFITELKKNNFFLVFHPIINAKTKQIVSCEVLTRWNHSEFGFVPPDQFIELLEETHLVNQLTRWVVNETFDSIKEISKHHKNIKYAVNFSSINLCDHTLIADIEKLFDEKRIPPNALKCELTEHALVESSESLVATLKNIKNYGIMICIDDYGKGFSNLSYLHEFPIDQLKIDKSFITDIETNQKMKSIVKSTIDLAHELGIEIVCEGVETKEIVDLLSDLDADYIQGYYVTKPLKIDEFIEFTEQWNHNH